MLETNTFDVFRKEDICVRGPLDSSCNRHPRPHISWTYRGKKISLHSPFCYFLPLISLAISGGLYLLRSWSSFGGGKASSENCHTNSIPPSFHSPAASRNTDD